MTLAAERLEILRALSHDRESLATCDGVLLAIVRDEIAKIGTADIADRKARLAKLKSLYAEYDLSIVRALFMNAHLVWRKVDIEHVLTPLLQSVVKPLKGEKHNPVTGRRVEVLV